MAKSQNAVSPIVDLWEHDAQERIDHEKRVMEQAARYQAGLALNAFEDWRKQWADKIAGFALERDTDTPGWDIGIDGPDAKQGAALLIAYAATIKHKDQIDAIKNDDPCAEKARQLMILAIAGKQKPLQASLKDLFDTGKQKGQRRVLRSLRLLTDTHAGAGISTRLLNAAKPETGSAATDDVKSVVLDPNPNNWTHAVLQKTCLPWFRETAVYATNPIGKDQAFGRLTAELMKLGLAEKIPNTNKWRFHRDAFQLKGVQIPAGCGIVIE